MGTLRAMLALAVVFAHSGGLYVFTGGLVAVQAFFMISGFYMALVLDGRYQNAALLFYSNRFLRIYPTYVAIAILSLFWWIAYSPDKISNLMNLGIEAKILLIFSNIFILGQDAVLFSGTHGSDLFFTSNYNQSNPPLYTLLLVPQAWSIALELTFYLVAPILMRQRSAIIMTIIILSLSWRLGFYYYGMRYDPWVYRFFPFEIALFLAGSMAYRFYRNHRFFLGGLGWKTSGAVTLGMLILTAIYSQVPLRETMKMWIFYMALGASLPMIFWFSKDNHIDRVIGELSYPIYVSHFLVVSVVSAFVGEPDVIAIVTATISCSILLYWLIERPMASIRENRVRPSITPALR